MNTKAMELWNKVWPVETHQTEYAQKRIKSAKAAKMTPVKIDHESLFGYFQGDHGRYETFLDYCPCGDFHRAKLPCKHIYRLALELGVMDGEVQSNTFAIPTPKNEKEDLDTTVDLIEKLTETAQRCLLRTVSSTEPEHKFLYKKNNVFELLGLGIVVDVSKEENPWHFYGRKDELIKALDEAGIPRPPKANKDKLAELCMESIPEKIQDKYDKWISIELNSIYSKRKIHYYLHRKLDSTPFLDPETGEVLSIPLLEQELPDDDVTGQLIKRGYYLK